MDPKFVEPKIILDLKSFGHKIILDPNNFWTKNFFDPNFLNRNFFGTRKFFVLCQTWVLATLQRDLHLYEQIVCFISVHYIGFRHQTYEKILNELEKKF